MTLETLKKRSSFQRLTRHGARIVTPGFILQSLARRPEDVLPARIGYTVSKKVGNAVERNRVKRRLRSLIRESGTGLAQAGWDYVLVGRRSGLHRSYERMLAEFERAMTDAARPKHKKHPKNDGKAT